LKKEKKGKLGEEETKELESQHTKCEELMGEKAEADHKEMATTEIYFKVKRAEQDEKEGKKQEDDFDLLTVLIDEQKNLKRMKDEYLNKQGWKWYFLFVMSVFIGILLYTAIVPAFNYVFVKSQPN